MPLFRVPESGLFRADNLAWVMAGLILFVVANVTAYSRRYLAGDRKQLSHHLWVLLLGSSVLCMVFADQLLVLLIAWTISNLLLIRLMIHKTEWIAARNAGLLALKNFGIGFILLGAGFWILAEDAGTASISEIISATDKQTTQVFTGLLLIAIATMTQSAVWPFHRWLNSSLNSPTPVSAIMHAGVINGGGFLLVRFSPLYASQPLLLHGIFMVGLITAVAGSFWKLIQTDIKRMLVCSTIGQMGFMLMQCGMGLFAPAFSHLVWHGIFKAYLFLNAGSVLKEKRIAITTRLSPLRIAVACCSGAIGALAFGVTSETDLSFDNTSCMMILLAFMATTQLAIGLLEKPVTIFRTAGTFLTGIGAGTLYGFNVRLIETTLAPLHTPKPQPMDAIYFTGFAVIVLVWMAMILKLPTRLQSQSLWKRLYMEALNASQPHPSTVSATRTTYQS